MEKTTQKNNQLFALPLSREYWRLAASEVHQLPKVTPPEAVEESV